MKKKIQKSLILGAMTVASMFGTVSAQMLDVDRQMIVAFYGRPGSSALGVLSQYSVEEVQQKVQEKADEYKKVLPDREVLPALDIIYELALASPGARRDYVSDMSESKIMPYLKLADEGKMVVFLDMQLGKNSPLESVNRVLKYLKYNNVHLAIDPEFEVKGIDKAPGKIIGHIDGDDVNQVQKAMSDYLKKNKIEGGKMLMVHNFTQKMVRNKRKVEKYNDIQLIMNLDGHGSPSLKVNTYNGIYTKAVEKFGVIGGFKLFFKEDHPMMTPKQVMGIEGVGKTKMQRAPLFVNYQ